MTPEDLFQRPSTDPTSIYRYRDGLYAVDLLTAALCHLDFFSWLGERAESAQSICQGLGLAERPADVMLTLFVAMELLEKNEKGFSLSPLAREHLVKSSRWNIAPYFASVKERPVCRDLVSVLRTGKPTNWASLKDQKEWAKAMEDQAFAGQFTAAMDCRGIYLGPAMAERLDCSKHRQLLDIAGGSGIYSCALVARHAHLKATVLERQPVDKIAREAIGSRGFADKVQVTVGDMFAEPLPQGHDIHLFSNVLHDWDIPKVKELLGKSFSSLLPGGLLVVHDAHINAQKTGPLPVAAYSALLMTITEGKCYSESEMREFLEAVGFRGVKYSATAADRSIITAAKPK